MAALVEGFILVTFPSASAIITGSNHYGVAGTLYGELVVPELVAAILASLTGFGLARRHTSRVAYILGISIGLAAMGLLIASSQVERDHAVAYPLLLAASALLGAGFGMTVPILLAYARFLHACAEDKSVLALNGLIAIGALIAPPIAALFVHMGFWLGLPSVSAALLLALLLCSRCLPAHAGAPNSPRRQDVKCRVRFSLYALFAMAYSVCAALLVIWSELRVARPPGVLTPAQLTAAVHMANSPPELHASIAYATFWGATLAAGRVGFAAVDRWRSGWARLAGYLIPLAVLGALMAAGMLTHHLALSTFSVFILAALGCAALLPLSISFTQKDVTAISAALAGGVIAYQLGYGLVAAGMRPHEASGARAIAMFGMAAVIGLIVSGLGFFVVRGRPALPAWAASERADNRSLARKLDRCQILASTQNAAAVPAPYPR